MDSPRTFRYWLSGTILVTIVLAWFVDQIIELRAVKFEGHSAQYWFRQYCMVRQPSTNAMNHALEMLIGAGSNAAPVLIRRMSMPDSSWTSHYAKVVQVLGPIGNYLPSPISPDYVRKAALVIFSKNKPAARAAKEHLINGYRNPDPFYRLYCLRALAQINFNDSKIENLLIEACSDKEPGVRNVAVYALAYSRTTSEKADHVAEEAVKRNKLARFLESPPSTLELDFDQARTKEDVMRRYVQ